MTDPRVSIASHGLAAHGRTGVDATWGPVSGGLTMAGTFTVLRSGPPAPSILSSQST